MAPALLYQHIEKNIERVSSRRQKCSEQFMPIKKTIALLFKPASPAPSNTGSARSLN